MRNKVKDLQEKIRGIKEDAEIRAQAQAQIQIQAQTGYVTPPLSDAVNGSFSYDTLSNTKEGWQGIQQQTGGTRAGSLYYGPMSSSYFVTRITRYLSSQALNRPLVDTMARFDYTPPLHRPPASHQGDSRHGPDDVENLSRSQEEYFLNLLWQTFHCVYPIISEPEFRQYYDSLWSDSSTTATRKPSALVDVLLAVCMQYGSTFLISDDDHNHHQGGDGSRSQQTENANMAAHAFYQRAQRLLQSTLEHPSIMVLQSHIYSTIYLYNASLLNTAHITLGVTVRIAHALRLHIRPLDGAPPEEQELRRRIWWTLYCLDSQLSMTLGRPPLIQLSQVSCGLPRDDRKHASLSDTALSSSHEDITWLSFHVQSTKLIFAVQGVQAVFQQMCAQLLSRDDKVKDIYDDPRTTEALAGFLSRDMTAVYEWVQNVPQSLRNARKGAGEAFSTDRAPLNLDLYSPLWLQRQRLLLELLYHHLQISTLRPFLRFPPVATSLTPLADSHSISCVNHAMAITSILNQVLFDTDLLRGWLPIFQYQWDATVCTLGFVLANPVCPPTPSARKSLQTAIRILRLLGEHFPAAANAAQVAHEVNYCANQLIDSFRRSLSRRPEQRSSQSASPTTVQNPSPPATQTPFSAASQTASVPVFSEHIQPLVPTSLELSRNRSMPGFETIPTTTRSLTELSPTLGTAEPPSAMLPPVTSADMIPGNEVQWLHATSAMILDSWTDFTTTP